MAEMDIKIPCHITWKLLQEYDNSGNKNTTIVRQVEHSQSKSIKGSEYTKMVNETSREEASKLNMGVSATATWTAVSASVSSGYEASNTLKSFVSSTAEVTREAEQNSEIKDTQTITVGAGDKLYVYQQVFTGPGMYYTLDNPAIVSSKKTPEDDRDITITVRARAVEFVRELRVVHGGSEGEAPDDRVREMHGWGDDTNMDFGGKFVWLVPVYTHEAADAATGFEIIIQKDGMDGKGDLAAGTGGDFRYVIPNHNLHQAKKVVEVKMFRSTGGINSDQVKQALGNNWVGPSRDINAGRGKTFLYLVWRLH